jgi:hypothetical protein
MRDPARIEIVLASIHDLWVQHPDMRMGQLISNLCGSRDPFYVEDGDMVEAINEASTRWAASIPKRLTK